MRTLTITITVKVNESIDQVAADALASYAEDEVVDRLANMGGLAPYDDDPPHTSATLASAPGTAG